MVSSLSDAWREDASNRRAAPKHRSTGSLFVITALTLGCAAPVVLVAMLGWLGSASSATPTIMLLVALALFAVVLLAVGRRRDHAPARVTVREQVVEVSKPPLIRSSYFSREIRGGLT